MDVSIMHTSSASATATGALLSAIACRFVLGSTTAAVATAATSRGVWTSTLQNKWIKIIKIKESNINL